MIAATCGKAGAGTPFANDGLLDDPPRFPAFAEPLTERLPTPFPAMRPSGFAGDGRR